MSFALRDYGDRISQIGLFSFKVRSTGEIYESGVSISSMLTYINKYPHINWLLTISNDGTNSIFAALRDNTDGAQDMFLLEIVCIMENYPWCSGIDIDLERGDGYSTHAASTQMFANTYNTVKAYDSSKMMNICLPGMTSVNGSVGGENWCVYADLNDFCEFRHLLFNDPVHQTLSGVQCGFILIQNNIFQFSGRACHNNQTGKITALTVTSQLLSRSS